MNDTVVFNEKDRPFRKVDWGRTKGLVAAESIVDSEFAQVRITEYEPGRAHERHIHPDQEEVIFVLSGRGYSETAAGKKDIGPGDVVFVPAGVEHATYNPNREPLRAVIIKSPPDEK